VFVRHEGRLRHPGVGRAAGACPSASPRGSRAGANRRPGIGGEMRRADRGVEGEPGEVGLRGAGEADMQDPCRTGKDEGVSRPSPQLIGLREFSRWESKVRLCICKKIRVVDVPKKL